MKTVLVATDLSVKSRAAMRFAIQLASQGGFKLIFFHSFRVLEPTGWSIPRIVSYEKSESTKILRRLIKFVNEIYQSLNLSRDQNRCVVKHGIHPEKDIMSFAATHDISYICIGRKGLGKSAGLFGSTVSKLIKASKTPVIAVPDTYRRKIISQIMLASDLENLKKELELVRAFNMTLHAELKLLHFTSPADQINDSRKTDRLGKILTNFKVKSHFQPLDYEKTLIENIDNVIKYSRPSLLVMFTDQERTFFQNLFMSSIAAEYSARIDIPLLTFCKENQMNTDK